MNDEYDVKAGSDYGNGLPVDEQKPTGNGLAITSMILGISSLVACMGPLTGIPAVICGHIARGKGKRGDASGDGMALAGLITGYMGICFIVFLMLPALLLPALSSARGKAREIQCMNNLKQIGLCLRMYSNVYDEQFPPYDGARGLDVLRSSGFLDAPKVFVCPSTDTKPAVRGVPFPEKTVDYVYIGGLSEADPPNSPIAYDKPENHSDSGNVLFVDGHVKKYTGKEWEKIKSESVMR